MCCSGFDMTFERELQLDARCRRQRRSVADDQHPAARPELGVGITFSSAIEPMLDRHPELIDVVEIEPQTTWLDVDRRRAAAYRRLDDVASYRPRPSVPEARAQHRRSCRRHGRPDPDQVALFRDTIAELESPWVSEHLSFNGTGDVPHRVLPAAASDRRRCGGRRRLDSPAADELGVPLAFETGVNYLARRPDEMDDGAFVAAVAEGADCGHPARPPQRLHERRQRPAARRRVHRPSCRWSGCGRCTSPAASGWTGTGWTPTPDRCPSRCSVRRGTSCPDCRASVRSSSRSTRRSSSRPAIDEICRQLELLRELWSLRGTAAEAATSPRAGPAVVRRRRADDAVIPATWEAELGSLVVGRPPRRASASSCPRTPASPCCRSWRWSSAPR